MSLNLSLDVLLEYTQWERDKWHDFLHRHGDDVLKIGAGPRGDGRFETVGDLVRHIFSAEKRYVERLLGQPLTDTASISNSSVEALFDFSRLSRKALQDLLATLPAQAWDVPEEYKILNFTAKATPRKIVTHVLMHEIRHWAQIATILRFNGIVPEMHDFIASPVLAV